MLLHIIGDTRAGCVEETKREVDNPGAAWKALAGAAVNLTDANQLHIMKDLNLYPCQCQQAPLTQERVMSGSWIFKEVVRMWHIGLGLIVVPKMPFSLLNFDFLV
jgi:hypothetical protein